MYTHNTHTHIHTHTWNTFARMYVQGDTGNQGLNGPPGIPGPLVSKPLFID